MGRSVTRRGGPGYQKENTNRGTESYSTGYEVPYEGTLMSGEGKRKPSSSARDKSGSIKGKKY